MIAKEKIQGVAKVVLKRDIITLNVMNRKWGLKTNELCLQLQKLMEKK